LLAIVAPTSGVEIVVAGDDDVGRTNDLIFSLIKSLNIEKYQIKI
jgi:hypothetical protein